jgi:hypothetical protein
MRPRAGPETILSECVLSKLDDHIFALWIAQEIAVLGAYGAIAPAHLGCCKRWVAEFDTNCATMAIGPVDLLRLFGHCIKTEDWQRR